MSDVDHNCLVGDAILKHTQAICYNEYWDEKDRLQKMEVTQLPNTKYYY